MEHAVGNLEKSVQVSNFKKVVRTLRLVSAAAFAGAAAFGVVVGWIDPTHAEHARAVGAASGGALALISKLAHFV